MPTRRATAVWEGGLQEGKGTVKTESGALDTGYSFGTRFGTVKGSNPEELLAAAEAACYAMALSVGLERAGTPPKRVEAAATCTIDKIGEAFKITYAEVDRAGDGARRQCRRVREGGAGDEGELPGLGRAEERTHRVGRRAGVIMSDTGVVRTGLWQGSRLSTGRRMRRPYIYFSGALAPARGFRMTRRFTSAPVALLLIVGATASVKRLRCTPDQHFLQEMANNNQGVALLAHETLHRTGTFPSKTQAQAVDKQHDDQMDHIRAALAMVKDNYVPRASHADS